MNKQPHPSPGCNPGAWRKDEGFLNYELITKKRNNMNFIRIFHPVGQGAFYTEKHMAGEDEFTIVYDCGSWNRKTKPIMLCEKKLKQKIKTVFYKKQKIDVLFISHFHYDHINGIEFLKDHCKIERVVMPYVDDKAKVLVKIFNRINGGTFHLPLIDDPQKFFGAIPIVTIKDFLPDAPGNNALNSISENLSDIRDSCKKESGTPFTLSSKIDDWYYIPYNFKDSERRAKFEMALKSFSLGLSDITAATVEKHIESLRKAYRKVSGEDLNESSMVLFSGGKDENIITCSGHCPSKIIANSGCLYTGDAYLHLQGNVTGLRNKLGTLYSRIGTLQVPHHGSKKGYDSAILKDSNIECAVVSYGVNNQYGHPCKEVIDDIKSKGVDVHRITEYSYILQKK
jgi:hypothetical protein